MFGYMLYIGFGGQPASYVGNAAWSHIKVWYYQKLAAILLSFASPNFQTWFLSDCDQWCVNVKAIPLPYEADERPATTLLVFLSHCVLVINKKHTS